MQVKFGAEESNRSTVPCMHCGLLIEYVDHVKDGRISLSGTIRDIDVSIGIFDSGCHGPKSLSHPGPLCNMVA